MNASDIQVQVIVYFAHTAHLITVLTTNTADATIRGDWKWRTKLQGMNMQDLEYDGPNRRAALRFGPSFSRSCIFQSLFFFGLPF